MFGGLSVHQGSPSRAPILQPPHPTPRLRTLPRRSAGWTRWLTVRSRYLYPGLFNTVTTLYAEWGEDGARNQTPGPDCRL